MEGRFLLSLGVAVITIGIGLPNSAAAYGDDTTHPALTSETAALHDRLYPEDTLTADERKWLMQGSIEEDIVPRSLNHLYDPVHRTGWTGAKLGWAPEILTRVTSLLAVVPDAPLASVEWIGADGVQAAYGRYGGNRSWPAGLRALGSGDSEGAFRSLGSSLHLLQDAGVPDHARDDTHVHHIDFLTGDAGSPYESYAKRYKPGSLNLVSGMRVSKSDVVRYRSPRDYLEDNARFASASFFSKDTIQDASFPAPVVTRESGGIAYGRAADGREVPLALRVSRVAKLAGVTSSLELADSSAFHSILEAQFRVIAERTALLGVGMIRDFKEAQKSFSSPPSATAKIWSLAGEIARVADSVVSLGSRATQALGAQFARGYDWLAGSFSQVASSAPVKVEEEKFGTLPIAEVKVKASAKTSPVKVNEPKVSSALRSPQVSAAVPKTTPAVAACPAGGVPSVVINEIAWMGTRVSASDEWVELLNVGGVVADLSGWELVSADGVVYGKIGKLTLPAGGFALLERTDDGTVPGVTAAAIYKGGLPNEPPAGYVLQLVAPGCGTSDVVRVSSGWQAGSATSRLTMERTASGSWQSSDSPDGTPGRANSEGSAPVVPDKELEQKPAVKKKTQSSTNSAPVVLVIDQGNLKISEMQSGGADAGDEWVELYNPESRPVSLAGWSLQYFPASSSSVAQKRDFPLDAQVPALGYYLVARELDGSGADGYRGSVAADTKHRSFSLSGLGATVALVRSTVRAETIADASVADWVQYPQLPAGKSYERGASELGTCLDPRPGAPGEFLGNGCGSTSWFLRELPEPQNSTSLSEPRTVVVEPPVTVSSTIKLLQSSGGENWISFSRQDLGIDYEGDADLQSWVAFVINAGTSTLPGQISTENQLELEIENLVQFQYPACYGSERSSKVLIIALSRISCASGGPLGSALDVGTWEDDVLWVKVGDATPLVTGEVVTLERYSFTGGGAGVQHFERVASSSLAVQVVQGVSHPPGAVHGLQVNLEGEVANFHWGAAQDADAADSEIRYEVSLVSSGDEPIWSDNGKSLTAAQQVEPGNYAFAVRAVDLQGSIGESREFSFEVAPPVTPENFAHDEQVALGTFPFELGSPVTLEGLALWIEPEGGPYCCSRVLMSLIHDDSGVQVAAQSGSRRAVDGDGEVEISLNPPLNLMSGRYTLGISVSPELSNGLRLKGGEGRPYLRLIVES